MDRQKLGTMREVVQSMSSRDREVLTRYYLYEQTEQHICQEMNFTETQLSLLKSRARARFDELSRKRGSKLFQRRLLMRMLKGVWMAPRAVVVTSTPRDRVVHQSSAH